MKSREIRLLYFKGCPNIEQARANLRAALTRAGLAARWEETDLEAGDCPGDWKGFPSPTILVDGAEIVTGSRAQSGTSSCRFGGAPSVELIARALRPRSALASLAAVPAALAGLLPVGFCPACYPALAGFLGALGLGAYAERLLAPLTLVLLLVALAGLGYQARKVGDYRPLAVGAVGAALMYAGQFVLVSSPVKIIGILLLVAASFWNVFPRLRRGGESCSACAEGR